MTSDSRIRAELVRENEALRSRVVELETKAYRYKTTLYSIGDAVITTDAMGTILEMNTPAETLTGWRQADATGCPLGDVFHIHNEEPLTGTEATVEPPSRDGVVRGAANHSHLIAKNGGVCPIAYSSAPIRGAEGDLLGSVLVFRDQTRECAAKNELAAAEERFRVFFDNAPIGKSMTAPNGQLLRVNRAFCNMLGYSLEEMQRISFADITHPDDLAESKECVRSLLAGERDTWSMQKRYLTKQGQVVWTRVVTRLQRDAAGKPAHMLTHILDLSDLKRAERALRDSEQRQRFLYESDLLGVVFWNIQGQLLDANDNFLSMVGYTRDDLQTGRIDWLNMTPPEYRYLDIASLAELRATKINRATFDKVYVRKDGTHLPVTVAMAMLDEERTNGIAIVLDITERKQAESQLANKQTLLQNIIESVGTAVFSVDPEYRYTSFNTQHAASVRSLHGANIKLGQSALDYPRQRQAGDRAKIDFDRALGGEHWTEQLSCNNGVGGRSHVEIGYHPIRNESGCIVGVAVVTRDTTAQRRAEEELRTLNEELDRRVVERTLQLEESNQELDAFSYSVSHDLRAPLRAIDGFTRILADDYALTLDTEGQRLCGIVRENTARMNQLINDLLAFSRLGRASMTWTRVDMETMANAIYFELTTAEARKRIDFQLSHIPPATADSTLMRQVWTNLISNAIKFSSGKERAVIAVGSEPADGEEAYVIKDNGAGFDMRYCDKLFGVFQRLHSHKEFEGTGVGLALIQRIIRKHGGRVWGKGEIDQGASFYFTVPRTEA